MLVLRTLTSVYDPACEWCHPHLRVDLPTSTQLNPPHRHAHRAVWSRQSLIETLSLGDFRLCHIDIKTITGLQFLTCALMSYFSVIHV